MVDHILSKRCCAKIGLCEHEPIQHYFVRINKFSVAFLCPCHWRIRGVGVGCDTRDATVCTYLFEDPHFDYPDLYTICVKFVPISVC